jgi:hypothetical protein
MTLKTLDKTLTLAMKIMVLTIGISEYGLYKLWGKPINRLIEETNESASQSVREHEVIISRPTWWEWTQLNEWGYSDNPGTGCSKPIQQNK